MHRKWREWRKLFVHIAAVLVAANVLDCAAALAQAPATAVATDATESQYEAARKLADRQAKEWIARGIPGLALAVAVDGNVVYSEGFGYADLEERVPVWTTTKFRIGSVSKPLTAAALLRLVGQGKIDLDAPIQKYVPSFPDKGALITPRMLAGHLAGIRHYQDSEFENQKHYATVVEGLNIFKDDPLVAPPLTKFSYSSYGFNLLSAAIEKACGEEFVPCMHHLVFDPLGLRHTIEDQPAEIIEQRSRFYTHEKDQPIRNAPFVDNSYKWAGGGFLSTAEDLVRFGSALLRPGFLDANSLALLFSPQKTRDGTETKYGMGWSVGKSKSGRRIYSHSGGSVGGTSDLIIYPGSGIVVALVCNFSGEGGGEWKTEEVQSVAVAFEAEKK